MEIYIKNEYLMRLSCGFTLTREILLRDSLLPSTRHVCPFPNLPLLLRINAIWDKHYVSMYVCMYVCMYKHDQSSSHPRSTSSLHHQGYMDSIRLLRSSQWFRSKMWSQHCVESWSNGKKIRTLMWKTPTTNPKNKTKKKVIRHGHL